MFSGGHLGPVPPGHGYGYTNSKGVWYTVAAVSTMECTSLISQLATIDMNA